ncbi:hypothetical protein H6F77_12665 [Microcoleus sp. FACHB-831]|uniref:hypothetical protein n=1 Tax=Microcoleus sp. FACHB-831 TaxID=2692827 RepID=UPI00168970FF|nr:hypothetical protein [Microcoleus sp. FACHB-831]MBD1921939.1 hypothetical protein [Microcoleus sp. FACHB-831]
MRWVQFSFAKYLAIEIAALQTKPAGQAELSPRRRTRVCIAGTSSLLVIGKFGMQPY